MSRTWRRQKFPPRFDIFRNAAHGGQRTKRIGVPYRSESGPPSAPARQLVYMNVKQTLNMLVEAGKEFLEDDVPQAAAALSFYAVTALPPLVMILSVPVDSSPSCKRFLTRFGKSG